MDNSSGGALPRWLRRAVSCLASGALLAVGLTVPLALPLAAPAQAATCPAGVVTALHAPVVTIKTSSPAYTAAYLGYKITPTSKIDNLWVGLSNFTGGVVTLAANQTPQLPSGALASGASAYTYFMARASGATTTDQSHTITVYDGSPTQPGATVVCTTTNTITDVFSAAENNSNKVDSISVATSGQGLGSTATVTVNGTAGQVSASEATLLVPTGNADFPSGAWRLTSTRVVAAHNSQVYSNVLRINGEWLTNSNTAYTATYIFTAVGQTSTAAELKPIQYIGKDTTYVVTKTLPATATSLPTVGSGLSLSKAASATSVPATVGGDVEYTVTVTNAGTDPVSIDEVVDRIPAGSTFVAGSAKINGSTVADPDVGVIGGSTSLTFVGPYPIPGGPGTRTFSYTLRFPVGLDPGSYVNSAIANVGSTIVGASGSTPAKVSVSVVAAPKVASATAATQINTPVTITPTVTGTSINSSLTCLKNPGGTDCVTPLTVTGVGAWVVNSDGTVTFTPETDYTGVTTAILRVTDALGQSAEGALTVSVSPIPQVGTATFSTPAETAGSVTMSVTYTNGAVADLNSACLVSPSTGACEQSVTVSGVGVWQIDASNPKLVTFTPAVGYTGTTGITYVATDSSNKTGSGSITVTVTNPTPPTVLPASVSTSSETPVTIDPTRSGTNLVASETCVIDPADSVCRSFVSVSNVGVWQVNTSSFALTFTPAPFYAGTTSIPYRISDRYGQTATATMTVTVSASPATTPVITTQPSSVTAALGSSATLSVVVQAPPAGQTQTYQWYRNGSLISGATSTSFEVNPVTEAKTGSYSVVIVNTNTSSGSTASLTSNSAVLDLSAPTVSSVSPTSGLASGGTAITVTGTGFAAGATVSVGGAAASSVAVASTTQITATTPAGSVGARDVVVTNPDGKTGTLNGGFTYDPIPAPTITSISPVQGPVAGNTLVTITGTNLIGASVTFGGTAATAVTVNGSGTELTMRTPARPAGAVDVVVTTGVGTPATAVNGYTYIAAPTITGISPSSGSVTGGTSITITGTGLAGTSSVLIGGTAATSVVVVSDTQVTAVTPAGSVGAANVVLTASGGSTTSSGGFTYTVGAPTINTQPSSQTVAAGSAVSFSVSATASDGGTLTYRWSKDGAEIVGATSSTYSIASASSSSAGTYSVVVTNTVTGGSSTTTSNDAVLTVVTPPSISTQPTDRTVVTGASTSFSVVATGSGTLTYQWRLNGSNITGATSDTYEIASAASGNAGIYSVVVTNTVSGVGASVVSDNATLTIATAQTPTITQQPENASVLAGGTANFSVTAAVTDGGSLSYQWYFKGNALSGKTLSTLQVSPVSEADTGAYTVVVTNTKSGATASVTSSTATLSLTTAQVPVITTQPLTSTVPEGGSVTLTVVAGVTDGGTLTYQWRKNGVDIGSAVASTLTISPVAPSDAGSYTVVVTNTKSGATASVTSSTATLTVATAERPTIDSGPVSTTVAQGSAATFEVTASVTDGGTLSYQWYRNGTPVDGATGRTFTIAAAALSDVTDYTVLVTNTNSGATASQTSSIATLTVVSTPSVTGPANVTVDEGSTATLTVTASGNGTLTYSWSKGGTVLTGATGASLVIPNAATSDAGTYTVTVTNTIGSTSTSTTSSAATLTVNAGPGPAVIPETPVITSQPVNSTVVQGSTASFTVVVDPVSDGGTLSYEWRKGSTPVTGGTTATLTLSAVTASVAGDYSVVITNTLGAQTSTVTSVVVTLSVVSPPVITRAPASTIVDRGSPVTLNVVATGGGVLTYQWRLDGSNLAGETTDELVIAAARTSDAGVYTVVVTNTQSGLSASTVSSGATLTVRDPDAPPAPAPSGGGGTTTTVLTPTSGGTGLGSLGIIDNAETRSATLQQPVVLVDRIRVPAEAAPNANEAGMDVWSRDWRIEYRGAGVVASAQAASLARPLTVNLSSIDARTASMNMVPTGVVRVKQGGELVATASGFMPDTSAVLYLLDPPIALAVVQVTADGAFEANVLIPSSLTPGTYLSQVNGYTADGQVRSVTLGFEVVDNPQATPKQLRTKVFFDARSSSVNKKAKQQIAKALKRLPKGAQDVSVQVIGYVQPDRTPNNDDELSTARAMNVARVMARSGLKGRYYVSGQGRANESTKQARRVEVTIGFTIR